MAIRAVVAGIAAIAAGGAGLFAIAATFGKCGTCLAGLPNVDPCFIDLTHWSQCESPCVNKPTGTAVCGGPAIDYGLAFFQCQDGYPGISGACKQGQFCDPNKPFAFGQINPPQCADCDNDRGQAPSSSYHNGEGYCQPAGGSAPGWRLPGRALINMG